MLQECDEQWFCGDCKPQVVNSMDEVRRLHGKIGLIGKIMECLREVKWDRRRVCVAVVGVMRCPRENRRYEEMRKQEATRGGSENEN